MKVVALKPNKEGTDVRDLAGMSGAQLSELSTKTINRLDKDITMEIAELLKRKAELQYAIEIRYSQQFVEARKAKDGDYGLVRVEDGDYVIEQTVPKNVSWDQDKLDHIEDKLRNEWDEDPTEYIETKRSVQEKKYSAWPTTVKRLFQPARTVKPGKVKIEIKRKGSQHAAV